MHDSIKSGKYERDSFDAATAPITILNLMGNIELYIMDPVMIQELFTSKNQFFDKNGVLKIYLESYFGNSFLFSIADKAWLAKRRSTAHAFYKDKIDHLLEILKTKLSN